MSTEANQAVANPDEQTSAELRRLLTGMQDALTDEMVTRLAQTLAGGAGLLDQIERSGAHRAIPLLTTMLDNGDLQRVAQLARVIGAVQDALSDEMIVRLGELVSGSMTLLDRLNRSGLDRVLPALPGLVEALDRMLQQHLLEDMLVCMDEATAHAGRATPAGGGLKGLWSIAREPETQETLRFLLQIGQQFRACRAARQSAQSGD